MERKIKSIDPSKYDFEKINGEAHGNFSSVTVHQGHLRKGSRERVFRLVQRRPLDTNDTSIPTQTQIVLREHIKKAGVPVIPTYRVDEKTGDVYMTDLTRAGRSFVFSSEGLPLEKDEFLARSASGEGRVTPQQRDEFFEKMYGYALACGEQEILFSGTNLFYFIADKKKPTVDVVAGDLKHLEDKFSAGADYVTHKNMWRTMHALAEPQVADYFGWTRKEVQDFFRTKGFDFND